MGARGDALPGTTPSPGPCRFHSFNGDLESPRFIIHVPLLAFVDDGVYLIRSHEGQQTVLNATSRLYSLLGLERNEEKCFAAELDPERGRDPRCHR